MHDVMAARDPDYAVALFWRRATMQQTQKQKMLAGQLYHANDPEIQADQQSAKAWMVRYNAALGATGDVGAAICPGGAGGRWARAGAPPRRSIATMATTSRSAPMFF